MRWLAYQGELESVMRMRQLRLKNFQSFGPTPTEIELSKLTFILGPNGAGQDCGSRRVGSAV